MGRVALITGSASGIGLAVAKHLAIEKEGWKVVLLDSNGEAGAAAAASIPDAVFVEVDVTSWSSLSRAFDETFAMFGGIDFVYANAGIFERGNFYEDLTAGTRSDKRMPPPPPPNLLVLEVNLKAIIMTSYLAQHYFRLSPHKGKDAALVMTSSVCGLYPSQYTPIYAATKAGVVNFMRSIAPPFYTSDGIRVYAICPGSVRTDFLNDQEWAMFPAELFTPMSTVATTVAMLLEGGDMTDAWGRKVVAGQDYGLAVEINRTNIYFRDPPEYCDDAMKATMEGSKMESQAERLSTNSKRGGS